MRVLDPSPVRRISTSIWHLVDTTSVSTPSSLDVTCHLVEAAASGLVKFAAQFSFYKRSSLVSILRLISPDTQPQANVGKPPF